MNLEQLLKEGSKKDREIGELRGENEYMFRLLEQLHEMLMWCGGSDDFAVGGKARIGWERGGIPTLERAGKLIESIREKDKEKVIRP